MVADDNHWQSLITDNADEEQEGHIVKGVAGLIHVYPFLQLPPDGLAELLVVHHVGKCNAEWRCRGRNQHEEVENQDMGVVINILPRNLVVDDAKHSLKSQHEDASSVCQ